MRKTFDELWIIDLGGDNLGTRKTPNVFNIQTPVAIAIGVRGPQASPETPAKTHYTKVTGDTREAKLVQLAAIENLASLPWTDCAPDWQKPLLPIGKGDFFDWPLLSDLFPCTFSGVQFKRSWPIGETDEVLLARWKTLVSATPESKRKLFRETKGWKISKKVKTDGLPGALQSSIAEAKNITPMPRAINYAFRSYDRHRALYDFRLGDRLRPPLYLTLGERQLYFTTLLTSALAVGQALVATAYLPDLHHFRGSFGGKDVIPLFRDTDATAPNLTKGLLEFLASAFASPVSAEDFAAYVYAVLACQEYTARFWNELETPGPRVPVTKNDDLFRTATKLGRRLIWLHTYGERFHPDNSTTEIPSGSAKAINGISNEPKKYPEEFYYDPIAREIRIGEGRIDPVLPEIWNFEVSGLKVVQSWLAYRMKDRAGKKSSALDDIRPERWAPRMTDELLELLWVLEATLTMEPELSGTLNKIVEGPCFLASEFPHPTEAERRLPKTRDQDGDLLAMMEGETAGEDEERDED